MTQCWALSKKPWRRPANHGCGTSFRLRALSCEDGSPSQVGVLWPAETAGPEKQTDNSIKTGGFLPMPPVSAPQRFLCAKRAGDFPLIASAAYTHTPFLTLGLCRITKRSPGGPFFTHIYPRSYAPPRRFYTREKYPDTRRGRSGKYFSQYLGWSCVAPPAAPSPPAAWSCRTGRRSR